MRKILITVFSLILSGVLLQSKNDEEVKTHFFQRQSSPLFEATSIRHMEAGVPGKNLFASMEVQTKFFKNNFTYTIVKESGPQSVRKKMRAVLSGEADGVKTGSFTKSSFGEDNYMFSSPLLEAGIWKLSIEPKRKENFLINGFLLLGENGELYGSQGKLAKNPSFWIKSVFVSVKYQDIQGLDMPVRLDTKATIRILGESFLSTEYTYLSVNGVPVESNK